MTAEDKKLLEEIKNIKKYGNDIYAMQAAEREAYFSNPDNAKKLDAARFRISIAKVMYNARVSVGLTQEELAKKLHTRQSYIAEVENGKRNITIDNLERYAVACGRHIKLTMV